MNDVPNSHLCFHYDRSTGPLSFGFASLENTNGVAGGSKFFSNPVADLGIMTTPSLSQPHALQTELLDANSETDQESNDDLSFSTQNGAGKPVANQSDPMSYTEPMEPPN